MNETIKLMRAHRSIRAYTGEPISSEQLDIILAAAQQAPSSSFLQAVSIIRITDKQIRQQIMHLAAEQPYISEAAEFLLYCADFNRHVQIAPEAKTGFVEQLLIGAIDAAMMGQNMLVAAESLGLGGVFIGAVRNHPAEISKLLGLPELVIPLFGLCLGHPAQDPQIKPRLPKALMLHENHYQPVNRAVLEQYDQEIQNYYASRSSNNKEHSWTSQIKGILSKEARPFMLDYLQQQGYCKK
ncbi:oxygen-insensitive NADPH nitroreductase [Tolumonas lignilytica]|jgi:Nitroreductase|uniref:oxygen-insensitive NADPH nitroreductase n=1 Tax=Tolumonas lignilytica TaxID=1283284 RepID=UPI000464D62D|nr:oxygen-insensitive NADPH nitroreductase [Tolumonas lignilytica]